MMKFTLLCESWNGKEQYYCRRPGFIEPFFLLHWCITNLMGLPQGTCYKSAKAILSPLTWAENCQQMSTNPMLYLHMSLGSHSPLCWQLICALLRNHFGFT